MKLRLTISIPNWLDRVCAWPVVWYRKRKFGYTFRKIRLTEGKFAIVDQKDFYWLNNFQWCAKGNGQCIYAVRFVIEPDKRAKLVTLHRELMNQPKGFLVDNRNGDSLDNRRSNLRLATHSQNQWNRQKIKNATSRFVGVSFYKSRKKWVAYIDAAGKRISLGYFDSEIDAAKAYDTAAKKYHGEFARLNFGDEVSVS